MCGDSGEMDRLPREAPWPCDWPADIAGPDEVAATNDVGAVDAAAPGRTVPECTCWSVARWLTVVCVSGPEMLGPAVIGERSFAWEASLRRCMASMIDMLVSEVGVVSSAASHVAAAIASGS